jgi:WhiB family redox-sensing transcriptional regulator
VNLDETMRRVAADLDARYADYDLNAAQEDLENRILAADSAGGPPQRTPATLASARLAAGMEPDEPQMPHTEMTDLLVAVAVDLTGDPSAEVEGWGPRLSSATAAQPPPHTEDWRARASCREEPEDVMFVRGAEQRKAKLVCIGCPVRTECLSEALDNRIEYGVWGGMTERERRALLRRRPDVTSWRELLDSARHSTDSDDAAAG